MLRPILTFPVSTNVVLTFNVSHLMQKLQRKENVNIRVADIVCQLLLLSSEFQTTLNKVIQFLFNAVSHGYDPMSFEDHLLLTIELYIGETLDGILEQLMENYPLALNHLFDEAYFLRTGNVRLTSREVFLSQFIQQNNEISNHYDSICQDRLIHTLLTHYNTLLSVILNYAPMDDHAGEMVKERLLGFFLDLHYDILSCVKNIDTRPFRITPDTSIDRYGNNINIILERL